MPTLTPSYLYTYAALVTVSTLLVLSFMAYANALCSSSEARQLKNLMDYVVAKSTELLTFGHTTNCTVKVFLQMPGAIGNKQYWLQLRNDSSKAWLESGLGNTPVEGTELRVCLPKETSATGHYISGNGAACLECNMNGAAAQIRLSCANKGD